MGRCPVVAIALPSFGQEKSPCVGNAVVALVRTAGCLSSSIPKTTRDGLDPEQQRTETLTRLLESLPDDWLSAHHVGKLVNNPKNEHPRCVERVM